MENPVQKIRWVDRTVIIEVTGDIDLHRSSKFQKKILSVLVDKPEKIVLDLSDVPYMDSSGVASMVKMLSHANDGGMKLKIANPSEKVRSIMEITNLDSVFDLSPTVEDALN